MLRAGLILLACVVGAQAQPSMRVTLVWDAPQDTVSKFHRVYMDKDSFLDSTANHWLTVDEIKARGTRNVDYTTHAEADVDSLVLDLADYPIFAPGDTIYFRLTALGAGKKPESDFNVDAQGNDEQVMLIWPVTPQVVIGRPVGFKVTFIMITDSQ